MKRALITGMTSFLGLSLANRLQTDGVEVHGVIRATSDVKRLSSMQQPPVLHLYDGGMDSLCALVDEAAPDVVFHIAGLYRREHEQEDVETLFHSNVLFGAKLLEAMHASGGGRLISVGSYFQYMDGRKYRPVNLYAATKQAFQDVLAYYVDAGLVRAATLILYDVYGENDWRSKLMAAIRNAQRGGPELSVLRDGADLDMVHVDDVVAALLSAAHLLEESPDKINGGTFAVRSLNRRSISEIIELFEAVAGAPVALAKKAYSAPERSIVDSWDGPILPGWRPEVSLEEGIRRFIEEEKT
jgi:nucleoside-diphosphate-sugar epimerase